MCIRNTWTSKNKNMWFHIHLPRWSWERIYSRSWDCFNWMPLGVTSNVKYFSNVLVNNIWLLPPLWVDFTFAINIGWIHCPMFTHYGLIIININEFSLLLDGNVHFSLSNWIHIIAINLPSMHRSLKCFFLTKTCLLF